MFDNCVIDGGLLGILNLQQRNTLQRKQNILSSKSQKKKIGLIRCGFDTLYTYISILIINSNIVYLLVCRTEMSIYI